MPMPMTAASSASPLHMRFDKYPSNLSALQQHIVRPLDLRLKPEDHRTHRPRPRHPVRSACSWMAPQAARPRKIRLSASAVPGRREPLSPDRDRARLSARPQPPARDPARQRLPRPGPRRWLKPVLWKTRRPPRGSRTQGGLDRDVRSNATGRCSTDSCSRCPGGPQSAGGRQSSCRCCRPCRSPDRRTPPGTG